LILAVPLLFAYSNTNAQCGGSVDKSAKVSCTSATAKIAAINFHGDNCPKSKILDSKVSTLNGKFGDNVVFVEFDLTDENSKVKTKNLAAEQGLTPILESNNGTGFIVLYDLKSKKVLAKIDNSLSANDMEQAIKNYL